MASASEPGVMKLQHDPRCFSDTNLKIDFVSVLGAQVLNVGEARLRLASPGRAIMNRQELTYAATSNDQVAQATW